MGSCFSKKGMDIPTVLHAWPLLSRTEEVSALASRQRFSAGSRHTLAHQ
jgi:hypothetical protein